MGLMETSARARCARWLEERLEGEEVASAKIYAEAAALGFSEGCVYRAATTLGVVIRRESTWAPRTTWKLP